MVLTIFSLFSLTALLFLFSLYILLHQVQMPNSTTIIEYTNTPIIFLVICLLLWIGQRLTIPDTLFIILFTPLTNI